MGLFGSPKIDGNELQECLAYFEAQTKITAFQTKEADLYNNAMVKYGNSITVNPLAASEACKAAKRLSQAATEVLRRHEEIKNVPTAASLMHHAWYVTLFANEAWASATVAAVEAMTQGMNPNTAYIQQLVREYREAWRRADKESLKFLKRLKVSAEDIAKITARATRIDDNWEPEIANSQTKGTASSVPPMIGVQTNESSQSNMRRNESKIVLLKDKEWSVIDGDVCKVTAFTPLGSFKDESGAVRSMDISTPYAAVTIENKKLGNNATGYICHKVDFGNLWAAFKERTVREDEEVLVFWTRRNYKSSFKLFSATLPRLIVWICHKGAFDLFDSSYMPELTGDARSKAMAPIAYWKPDVMK